MPSTYLPLQLWNKHWQLNGKQLSCRRCRGVQYFGDTTPFRHERGCIASRFHAQYPFLDLGGIVEQNIQADLF
nr:hypothetical protein pA16J1_p19 [Pseudomonas sp.]